MCTCVQCACVYPYPYVWVIVYMRVCVVSTRVVFVICVVCVSFLCPYWVYVFVRAMCVCGVGCVVCVLTNESNLCHVPLCTMYTKKSYCVSTGT